MRRKIFRVLSGLIGAGCIIVGIPAALHYDGGLWPQWVHVATMVFLGIVFIVFAISGRAWPSYYGQDVFDKNDDLNDR